MLIQAFAGTVLDVIEDADLKQALNNWVGAKLPQLAGDA
jgi:hypothetical protein